VVNGWYNDANTVAHGFLRSHTGQITTFNVPGAGTGTNQGTLAGPLNQFGVMTGWYVTDDNVNHGYIRYP
jgi:predicted membrane protein